MQSACGRIPLNLPYIMTFDGFRFGQRPSDLLKHSLSEGSGSSALGDPFTSDLSLLWSWEALGNWP
jgi:hypothetical protein